MVMSCRPVRGRSRTVASSWISSWYSLSTPIVTIARPFSSSTSVMSPTWTPAMFTVWPCPGVTACAVSISTFSSNWSSPRNGIHDGYGWRCCERIAPVTARPITTRARIATKSRRCSLIARLMGSPPGRAGRPPRRARSGRAHRSRGTATSMRKGGGASGRTGWIPSGASTAYEKFRVSWKLPPGLSPWTSCGPPPGWMRRYGPLPSNGAPAPASCTAP